ncbi:hypothetical protein M5K25_019779 [Dendrobium thyrsiflorum]|uniref:Uncharacterized protein n=1 Tax=Dendrobium thyrsiflorum TaxID=117978 RepID=A0ABD0UFX5_DENTH
MQLDLLKSNPSIQVPFHLDGIAVIPLSSKLGDSGQIPSSSEIRLESIEHSLRRMSIDAKTHDPRCDQSKMKPGTSEGVNNTLQWNALHQSCDKLGSKEHLQNTKKQRKLC